VRGEVVVKGVRGEVVVKGVCGGVVWWSRACVVKWCGGQGRAW